MYGALGKSVENEEYRKTECRYAWSQGPHSPIQHTRCPGAAGAVRDDNVANNIRLGNVSRVASPHVKASVYRRGNILEWQGKNHSTLQVDGDELHFSQHHDQQRSVQLWGPHQLMDLRRPESWRNHIQKPSISTYWDTARWAAGKQQHRENLPR